MYAGGGVGFDLSAGTSLGQRSSNSSAAYTVNSPRAVHTPHRPSASPPAMAAAPQTPYQRAMAVTNNLADSWNNWPTTSQKPQARETLSPGPAPQSPTYAYPASTPSAPTMSAYTPAARYADQSTPSKPSAYSAAPLSRAPSGSPPASGLALASKFKFHDREVDRIAAQLHTVQQYKTTSTLVLHTACCCLGVVVLLYACLSPMAWLSTTIPMGRESVQIGLALVGVWLIYTGTAGLQTYSALQLPLREIELLSDRQKALMGWQTGGGGSAPRGAGLTGQRYPTSQEEVAANERMRRRRVESQIAPTPIASSQSAAKPAGPPAVPSASLRFLDPTAPYQSAGVGSPAGLRGMFGAMAQSMSPFKTRGLDSRLVNDESSLQGFVNEYSSRREDAGSVLMTPPSNRYGSSVSPRNAAGGFGNSAGYPSLNTPPYATSLRESTPAVPVPVSSSGAPGVQPFTLPGVLRYALEDPRSDIDLYDVFHSQLIALRLSTQELDVSVRRVRAWLVSTILRPFLRALDQTAMQMASLAKMVLSQPNIGQHLQPDEIALLREYLQAASSTGPNQPPPPPTQRSEEALALLRAKFPQRPECVARATVDQMLQVQVADGSSLGSTSTPTAVVKSVSPAIKSFVARRLLQLCAPGDDSLSKYSVQQANGGAGVGLATGAPGQRFGNSQLLFGGLRSNSLASAQNAAPAAGGPNSFPSDAQILLHVLCTHLDTVTPGFAQQYVRDAALTPNLGVGSLPRPTQGAAACIVQVRPAHLPSYFIVARAPPVVLPSSGARVAPSSAVKWVTEPGRPSLFQAIVLWIRELGVGSRLAREFTGLVDK